MKDFIDDAAGYLEKYKHFLDDSDKPEIAELKEELRMIVKSFGKEVETSGERRLVEFKMEQLFVGR